MKLYFEAWRGTGDEEIREALARFGKLYRFWRSPKGFGYARMSANAGFLACERLDGERVGRYPIRVVPAQLQADGSHDE